VCLGFVFAALSTGPLFASPSRQVLFVNAWRKMDMKCSIAYDCILPSLYTDAMSEYITMRHTDQLREILEDQNPSTAKHHSVVINFLDLCQDHLVLGTVYIHHPDELQPLFDSAVVKAQEALHRTLGAQVPQDLDFPFMSVKASCHLRMRSLPRCPELWKPTVTSIRAADINRLLTVSGTVIRTGQMKLIHQRREYKCSKCDHRFHVESDFEQRNEMLMPLECPSAGLTAKACSSTKFEPIAGTETCRDYQEVKIQEQVHRLTVGSIPR
jgi:DNA helicase MCM9